MINIILGAITTLHKFAIFYAFVVGVICVIISIREGLKKNYRLFYFFAMLAIIEAFVIFLIV